MPSDFLTPFLELDEEFFKVRTTDDNLKLLYIFTNMRHLTLSSGITLKVK